MAARVVVLGATGYAGREICRLLLDDGMDVVACARREDRLRDLESSLAGACGSLTTTAFDLRDPSRLDALLGPADVVVGATSSWRDGPWIAKRAIQCGTSYLGIYLSNREKWAILHDLHEESVRSQVTLIEDGGAHPGLPGAMIRFLAERFGLSSAWVGARFRVRWSRLDLAPETVLDFVSELETMDPSLYLNGEWVNGYRHSRRFDFGEGVTPASCVPMCMEEIREITRSVPGLQSTGFFMAGFGPLVDYAVLPLGIGLGKLSGRAAARLVWWGLRRFESRHEFAALTLEGTTTDGRAVRMSVTHPDPYVLTAVPAVATVRQLLATPRAGVWTQAGFVDPGSFFKDVESMGPRIDWDTA